MSTVQRLSPEDALAKMREGYTYVDVRSESEFEEGHPEGAVNVPLMQDGPGGMVPNPDFVAVMKATFSADAKLVLGCRSGGRSMRAAEVLLGEGYAALLEQRAGWDGVRSPFGQITEPGWWRVDLPSETGTPEGRSYADVKARAGKSRGRRA